MKHFASLSGYGITRVRKLMKEYVAHGEMERVPRVNGCFRPTKGNFGREELYPINKKNSSKTKICAS